VADLKAKLRPSAQISRQYYRGERWYVVRDPAGNQFHRLSAPAYRFVGLLDGRRTVAEAWELVGGQLADDAPTQNEVIQIMSQLTAANLLEADVTPDAAVLLRRHKQMVKRQWQGRLMNILFPRIPIWDPDRFICRWMPVIRPFLSWWGAMLWLVVIGIAAGMLAPEWKRLMGGAHDAIAPSNWLWLWLSFVLIKVIHELGHGFACRRFGGEVHELGIMFLVLVPCPYVDASTAWGFPSKWARIFVGAGGMIAELFVAAFAAFVWLQATPGTLASGLAYNVMLIASFSTVVFNANPLLRYDGYYILSDWLEIPNLRYRSSEYAMGLIKRHLFKVRQVQPLPPLGQRVWLFVYAITSSIYRMMVSVFIILMIWDKVPVLGVLMALGGVATFVLVPVIKTFKYLLIEAELHRKRPRAIAWTLAGVTAAVILIGVVPFPSHLDATGMVQPIDQVILHAREGGIVEQIVARDSQVLKKGEVILVCVNKELETQLAQEESQLKAMQAQWTAALEKDQIARDALEKKIFYKTQDVTDYRQRVADLTVRAPFDGLLVAPQLHTLQGKWIKQAEELARVQATGKLRITALVDQTDASQVFKEKNKAEVVLAGQKSGNLWRLEKLTVTLEGGRFPSPTPQLPEGMESLGFDGGGDKMTDPADQNKRKLAQQEFQIWVLLDNPESKYLPGQRAYVRFDLGKEPLFNWGKRRVLQLIQSYSRGQWT
jgi:putative peptide zinc metalloprotease protein